MRKTDILNNGSRRKTEGTWGRLQVDVRARESVNEQIREEIMRGRERERARGEEVRAGEGMKR